LVNLDNKAAIFLLNSLDEAGFENETETMAYLL